MKTEFKYFTYYEIVENNFSNVESYLHEIGHYDTEVNDLNFDSMKKIISKNIYSLYPSDYIHIPIGMN
jgi:hypothetical protein